MFNIYTLRLASKLRELNINQPAALSLYYIWEREDSQKACMLAGWLGGWL